MALHRRSTTGLFPSWQHLLLLPCITSVLTTFLEDRKISPQEHKCFVFLFFFAFPIFCNILVTQSQLTQYSFPVRISQVTDFLTGAP